MITPRIVAPVLFAVVFTLPTALPTRAAWAPGGNPVVAAAGGQRSPSAVADGTGGMIVGWIDQSPPAAVRATRLLADGTPAPGWPVDGVLLSGVSPAAAPVLVPTGDGGAIAIWLNGSIYAQRVDGDGALHTGWPVNGKAIASDSPSLMRAVTDGSGGAYIARVRYNPITLWHSIQVTRIDADGNFPPGWTLAGVALVSSESVSLFGLAPDPLGGVVVAFGYYIEQMIDSRHGRISRLNAVGGTSYTFATPAYASGNTAPYGIFHVAAAPNGVGGAYGTWFENSSSGPVYYGQLVSSTGIPQWTAPYLTPFSAQVVQDGGLGVWFLGVAPGTTRLEAHRRLTNGALPDGWTAAGFEVSEPLGMGSAQAAVLDTTLLVCWSEGTSSADDDIRALAIARDGTLPPGWLPGGSPVCTEAGDQFGPVLILDGQGGALACWEDLRSGEFDIYANRITPNFVVGVDPGTPARPLLTVRPNPARERIEVAFGLPRDGAATLELLDIAGRLVHRETVIGSSGSRTIGITHLAPGLYWARVGSGAWHRATRFVIVR